MMMAEIGILKKTIANQTCAIVGGLKTKLDKRNIGGDIYQATMVFLDVEKAHEMIYNELGSITRKVNDRVMYDNPEFEFLQIEN